VFLVASGGLRLYLSYVYSHGLTYGALATPITFLLFYYFAAMAIIIGAQFNNALLEYYPPRRRSRDIRRELRRREGTSASGDQPDKPGADAGEHQPTHV
jgi:membrane protein